MNGGKNPLLCDAEGTERGGLGLCILPETLFLAASLPLSVYSLCTGEAKFSHIETEAWRGNKNRNEFVVTVCRNSQGCSIIRTECDRWEKTEKDKELWISELICVLIVNCVCWQMKTIYITGDERWHIALMWHIYTTDTCIEIVKNYY